MPVCYYWSAASTKRSREIEKALRADPGHSDAYSLLVDHCGRRERQGQSARVGAHCSASGSEVAGRLDRPLLCAAAGLRTRAGAGQRSGSCRAGPEQRARAGTAGRARVVHRRPGYGLGRGRRSRPTEPYAQQDPNSARLRPTVGSTPVGQSLVRQGHRARPDRPVPGSAWGLRRSARATSEVGTHRDRDRCDPRSAELPRPELPGQGLLRRKARQACWPQFGLAKEFDPLDPTPPFYDAIRKQTANRPVEALRDLERSIELNPNRAVYRSQLLIDEDQAARTVSVARIHHDLGFDRLALVEAVKSSVLDPTSYSSRWFLSDAFGQQDRQEITRASELLHAQLLQPVSSMPVAPQLSFGNLNLLLNLGGSRTGYNEYSRLFEQNGLRGYLSGFAGNLKTSGDVAIASALSGRMAFSAGQFHYETEGFRPNNDIRHDIYNLFAQGDIRPDFSIQAEFRDRTTKSGDVAMHGEPEIFDDSLRRDFRNEIGRIGLRYSPSAGKDILVSVIDGRLRDSQLFPNIDIGGCVTDIAGQSVDDGTQFEIQYLSRLASGSGIVVGASTYRIRTSSRTTFTNSCLPNQEFSSTDRGHSAYVTGTFKMGRSLSAVLGLSKDRIRDANLTVSKLSPRLGLIAELERWLTFRASAAKSTKPALFASQTLRPTHVLGFSHFADDTTEDFHVLSRRLWNVKPRDNVYAGVELARRNTTFPLNVFDTPTFTNPVSKTHTAYAYWTPYGRLVALSAKYMRESVVLPFDDALAGGVPSALTTERLPLELRVHTPSGWIVGTTVQRVRQRVDVPVQDSRRTSFSLIDAMLGYRFPRRSGSFSIDLRNVLNRKFAFQDTSFLAAEPAIPPFIPHRSVVLRFSVDL